MLLLMLALPAAAQEIVLERGDAVVTGFSGVQPSTESLPAGADPLDYFFIDTEGPAAQIFSLSTLGGAANGQLATSAPKRTIKAAEVGQVFAVTLDDGLGEDTPNAYLGATSVYGIQIVAPGAGGAAPKRLKRGRADAQFMPGQFGPGPSGNPGTIWRVSGKTGTVSAFATIPGNSGPGIGDIVFDRTSRHFYVSDLDTGLVHRIGEDGVIVDSFDHGITGRPSKGLAELADDGKVMDITSPAFKIDAPVTWGYTQAGRRVWGMAIRDGRLYYAVTGGLQVWSVALDDKGGFGDDARWEFDATSLKGKGPIADMAFDNAGRLTLAQRGEQRATYNYASFVAPGRSSVVRFARDANGAWQPDADSYAVGMVGDHNYADGGIAYGYGYTPDGALKLDTCSATLWMSGSRMREGENASGAPSGDPAASDVHGIQGAAAASVRPANAPPVQSYFIDFDGLLGDAEKAGHVGDVAVWHSCDEGAVKVAEGDTPGELLPPGGELPPGFVPPGEPPELPPVFPPPEKPYNANLKLTKRALPQSCFSFGPGWACKFEIRVRNTGDDPYVGPILINEHLPASPAGALMGFSSTPPWNCWNTGPSNYRCIRPGTVLAPNASVGLTSLVWVPNTYAQCHLQNIASIVWAPPGTQWNSDPTDDIDGATALVPGPACPPPVGPTNLTLAKSANPADCLLNAGEVVCRYLLTVTNSGASIYNGEVQLYDEPSANATADFGPGPWNCANNGVGYDCTHPVTTLFPTQQLFLWSWVRLPLDVAQAEGCQMTNQAWITAAPGGTPPNLNPADDYGAATVNVPGGICVAAAPAQAPECPPGFAEKNGKCEQVSKPLPIITPTPVACPSGLERVRRSDVASLRRQGWYVIRLKTGRWCGRPGAEPPPPPPPPPPVDVCPHTMDRVPAWQVSQLRREGWDLTRVQGTNVWCGRPGRVKNPCRSHEQLVTNANQMRRLRNLGAKVRTVRWRGRRAWCAGPIGRPPVCNGGKLYRRDRGWFCVCPNNSTRRPVGNRGGAICLPKPRPEVCKPGERTLRSKASADTLRWRGHQVRKIGPRLWCASQRPFQCGPGYIRRAGKCIPVPGPKRCPPGTKGKWPACLPIIKKCPPGMVGRPPRCRPRKVCPPGTRGKWPACLPIIKKCPPGMVGRPPKCRPRKVCPPGTRGKWPACLPIVKRCPPGMVGRPPNCRPKKVCPRGTKGKWPVCVPIIKKCPRGWVGRPPNCRRVIKRCPPGTVGRPPNCRRIIKRCPPGTVGRPPNCKRVGRPKPAKCPFGYVGRPPNCKKVIKPPKIKLPKIKCPKGTYGKWPKCKKR